MNSTCGYGEERLAGLLYEDGDADEVLEIRAHLATCADCRAELESLVSMKDLLAAWPNVANVPRMVYVNERVGLLARLRRGAEDLGRLALAPVLKPALAAATVVVVLVAAAAALDVRVAPDGRLQVGFGGAIDPETVVADDEGAAAVSRDEFEQGMAQTVAYLEELFISRSDEERRVLLATIDAQMQEQGLAMSDQLRGAVDGALVGMQRQHENDLGLVFSAIDELGVITTSELQRTNMILASLMQRAPNEEE